MMLFQVYVKFPDLPPPPLIRSSTVKLKALRVYGVMLSRTEQF